MPALGNRKATREKAHDEEVQQHRREGGDGEIAMRVERARVQRRDRDEARDRER